MITDPEASLVLTPQSPPADRVRARLADEYPSSALGWVGDVQWQPQPVRIPLSQVQWAGDGWDDAIADRRGVHALATRMHGSAQRPVVAVRHPGSRLVTIVEGQREALAARKAGAPVTAWVASAPSADGPWNGLQAKRKAS